MFRLARAALAATLVLVPGAALAHTGVGDVHGLSHGFLHPIGGLDHILAMVGVGLLAARLGGRALWLVPLAFVGMMLVGGAVGMAGVELPLVETGIAASVLVLGLAVALPLPASAAPAMALAGAFAIFHGFAHGAEMPAESSGLAYAAGFVAGTILLHGAGMALGLAALRLAPIVLRLSGAAMALAGAGLLAGAL